jgi:hypothetical protein
MGARHVYHSDDPRWQVVAAAVTGTGHISAGQDCQDAFCVSTSIEDCLVAVLADGAGSASCGGKGAEAIVLGLTLHLENVIKQMPAVAMEDLVEFWQPHVINAIASVRASLEGVCRELNDCANRDQSSDTRLPSTARLAAHDQAHSLSDFHATVVGAIVANDGGVFFHIGDGVAVATAIDDLKGYIVSEPRNGETAEQTFFFTEPNWRENLRFVGFGPEHDLFVLLSDGAMTFAMAPRYEGLHPPFIHPINQYLRKKTDNHGAIALRNTLDSQAARDITHDDKTMIWAYRRNACDDGR